MPLEEWPRYADVFHKLTYVDKTTPAFQTEVLTPIDQIMSDLAVTVAARREDRETMPSATSRGPRSMASRSAIP